MYRIIRVNRSRFELYAPSAHKPFASYPTLVECTDVLLSIRDCDKFLVIL